MLIFMSNEVVNESPDTTCGFRTWGVRSNGHEPVPTFLHHSVWWPVEVSSPYIWTCVLANIVLNLAKCDEGLAFIAMFRVTGNDVEGISHVL